MANNVESHANELYVTLLRMLKYPSSFTEHQIQTMLKLASLLQEDLDIEDGRKLLRAL